MRSRRRTVSRGFGYEAGVSIIVVVYNRVDLTQKCLASIFEHTTGTFDVVVVDNGSSDATREWLKTQPVETVTLTENVGWGRGANAGAAVAKHDLHVHLNNDTEVHEGWLDALLAELGPDVGAVAGRLVNPDGSLQHAGVRLFFQGSNLVAENIATEQEASDQECIAGTAMLVRAEAFREAGGIDPGFRNGYEDVDFALRLREDGWRLRFTPDSTVTHLQHGSGAERWTHTQDNVRRLNELWAEVIRNGALHHVG